ncbi:MAG TPA: polyprenyl synthetase family protein [Thermoanaerobaculales bacterium]|nr:polyprenyl synthetase family protein [Thermoanaerobaculales bacterium]HPA80365.1 polyprenyl synthetase family protein [Thermoanaerobaculales bacterium]HQL30017.1 polyprenyl synthetase family protein [Thermoanaerobaculales bacterium]HQN96696.1 polyprenyl synthetase family protein [Thermoanaerobaculales bacterium]HQP94168.1 polyprenyl synthetase family protein [Thermoanaerobaculia bacterium]
MSAPLRLAAERAAVDAALRRLLADRGERPARLHEAMAYAVLAGGKRVRPVLARLAHAAAGGDASRITDAACGLELIHTYSLVHDDLPAMDDDVLRRGRPTLHVAFDEATAILAGDALLTDGLGLLASQPPGPEWSGRRAAAVAVVAEAAGSRGMVAGQVEDLEATGPAGGAVGDPGATLERIHRRKTGCLIRASVEVGAILAGVGDRSGFARYGERLGLAFQAADDVLDATATAGELGKSPGKDAAAGKLTFVTLHGLDAARRRLAELEAELVALASSLEGPDGPLGELASFIIRRTS